MGAGPISISGLDENTQEASCELSKLSRDELYWAAGVRIDTNGERCIPTPLES